MADETYKYKISKEHVNRIIGKLKLDDAAAVFTIGGTKIDNL